MEQQTATELSVQHDIETCEQCGGANLHRKDVRSAFWHDDRLVVVEDIPALVCTSCGGRYYEDATVVLLDLLHGEGFPSEKVRSERRVPVFSMRDMTPASDDA